MSLSEENNNGLEKHAADMTAEDKRVIWQLMQSVVDTAQPNETPQMRFQVMSILIAINALQLKEERLSVAQLSEILGIEKLTVSRLVLSLVNRGLVERTKVFNRLGRGHAYALRVKETPQLAAIYAEIRKSFVSGSVEL